MLSRRATIDLLIGSMLGVVALPAFAAGQRKAPSPSFEGGEPCPVDGRITIDASPECELYCARQVFPKHRSHLSTTEAVHNLYNAGRGVVIVGHGAPGHLKTRLKGGIPGQDDAIRFSKWTPYYDELFSTLKRRVRYITLFGCNVGGKDSGAKLLAKIAGLIEAPCYASTGLVYVDCDGKFSFQAGASCQKAYPGQPPPMSIEPPGTDGFFERNKIVLDEDGGLTEVDFTSVKEILFYPGPLKGKKPIVFKDEKMNSLLRLVDFQTVVYPPGDPLALISGYLEARFIKDGILQSRLFIVYNNLLLKEVGGRGFYDASLRLEPFLDPALG